MDADFDKLTHIMGEPVVDSEGHRIGRVTQVAYEPNTLRAEWLVLKTSLFGRLRLVPLAAAQERGDMLCVPFSRATVLESPIPDVPISPALTEASALEWYYNKAA